MDKEEPQAPTGPSNFPILLLARQESPSALSSGHAASAGQPSSRTLPGAYETAPSV